MKRKANLISGVSPGPKAGGGLKLDKNKGRLKIDGFPRPQSRGRIETSFAPAR